MRAGDQAMASDDHSEFFISEVMGRKIYDNEGRKVGRLQDLAAVWITGYPEVVGLKTTSTQEIIPLQYIADFGPQAIRLSNPLTPDNLRKVADDEIFVNRWLMDKQIVDIQGAKVERVNDIQMRWHHEDGEPRLTLMAVDIGLRGIVRRLGLKPLAAKAHEQLLQWDHFKPLTINTASLELTVPVEYIADMHPADIADIIQELHPEWQMQLLTSLAPKTAGVALAEVDASARRQLLAGMSAEQTHPLIMAMSPDDAADSLSSLPVSKQAEILGLMAPEKASEISKLMQHVEGTAGALMTTEFIAFHAQASVQELLTYLQEEQPDFKTWNEIFVHDERKELVGVIPLRTLILSHNTALLGDLMEPAIRLRPEDDFGQILKYAVKFNLLALPVVDEFNHLQGVITVDDVLTYLMENPRSRKHLKKHSYLSLLQNWAQG
jgi:magnesium transporter